MSDLVCQAATIQGTERTFFTNQLGICIPLGSVDAYHDNLPEALDLVVEFLSSNPPHLTEVYYESPNHQPISRTERIPVHVEEWKRHLTNLLGEDVGFISEWNLLPRSLSELIPPSYQGQILRRGDSPDIPVLVEWTEDLINGPISVGEGRTGFSSVWGYGTFGYVLPNRFLPLLEKLVRSNTVSQQEVEEFFSAVTFLFKTTHELDGIMVVSHKMDTNMVRHLLESD